MDKRWCLFVVIIIASTNLQPINASTNNKNELELHLNDDILTSHRAFSFEIKSEENDESEDSSELNESLKRINRSLRTIQFYTSHVSQKKENENKLNRKFKSYFMDDHPNLPSSGDERNIRIYHTMAKKGPVAVNTSKLPLLVKSLKFDYSDFHNFKFKPFMHRGHSIKVLANGYDNIRAGKRGYLRVGNNHNENVLLRKVHPFFINRRKDGKKIINTNHWVNPLFSAQGKNKIKRIFVD